MTINSSCSGAGGVVASINAPAVIEKMFPRLRETDSQNVVADKLLKTNDRLMADIRQLAFST